MFFWKNYILVCISNTQLFLKYYFLHLFKSTLCVSLKQVTSKPEFLAFRNLFSPLPDPVVNDLDLFYLFNKCCMTVVLVRQKNYISQDFFKILYRFLLGSLAVFHTVFILCSTNYHHNRDTKTKAKSCIRSTFPPEKISNIGEHTFLWMHTHNFHYC